MSRQEVPGLSVGDEFLTEAENRMRNLMWTVSGDYQLNTKLDVGLYARSKYTAMYDAIKQGAFARFFDRDAFGMYLIKKIYYGAQEKPLTEIAQLAVDAAVFRKISAERPGVPEIRRKAFADLLDGSFAGLSASLTGRLKLALLRGYLYGEWNAEKKLRDATAAITELERAEDVMELIRTVDGLYNTLIDRSFVKKHGDLEHVLAVGLDELQEFGWQDFLEEEVTEELLERLLNRINSQVVTLEQEENDNEKEQKDRTGQQKMIVIDEAAAAKMHSYIERNYGRSLLSETEQKRLDARLCRGAHADCSIHMTDGILRNPVCVNAQYVNAKRHAEKNERVFRNNRNMMARSIEQLSGALKRALYKRSEPEQSRSFAGNIEPNRLWRVGRMEDPGKLFVQTRKRNVSEFVVDVLMDASGSQRTRQSEVALQAYIISEALSRCRVPHRILSFCSFWDYTVLQRFREYDDPPSENLRLLEYVTSSNNRDGLAIRAAGDSLLQREEAGKILIVLSDGKPNDIIVNRPNCRNPRPYYGEYAVKDTAFEVRRLRGQGVCVLGVFTGREKELSAEKKIFGKDFAYIRSIEGFSKIVGKYLCRLLEEDGDLMS